MVSDEKTARKGSEKKLGQVESSDWASDALTVKFEKRNKSLDAFHAEMTSLKDQVALLDTGKTDYKKLHDQVCEK